MKKCLFYVAALIAGVVLSSCSSSYGLVEKSTRLLPVNSSAHTIPTIADLQVSSMKISHQVNVKNTFSLKELSNFGESPKMVHLEKLAATEAAQKYEADVIVAPSYTIATSSDFKTLTITVTGYPANYTNFRSATAADMEIIKSNPDGSMVVPCTSSSITDPSWSQQYTR